MRRISIALAFATLFAAGTYAQQKASYTPPKTAWGDPDLTGIWPSTDMVGVPFERPANLGERNEVTQEEFDARLKQQTTREEADAETTVSTAPRQGDGTGPPSHWLEWGKASKQASLLVEPRDGRLPATTPEAQRRAATLKNTYVMFDGFSDPSELGPYDRCISRGPLGSVFPVIYNNGNQIFQFPGYVVIRYEMIHEVRVVPLDGRAHVASKIRSYMGDPRGHWEGNTLVVETTNFLGAKTGINGNGNGVPTSDALKLTERYTRVDPNTINYEVTIDDPKTFTRPFKVGFPITQEPGYQNFEYACHEGNYAMFDSLSGARAQEKAAAETAKKK